MRRAFVAVALAAQVFLVQAAFPCGGPFYYDISLPIGPAETQVGEFLWAKRDHDGWIVRQEFWFLYPFRLVRPAEIQDLWVASYGVGLDYDAVGAYRAGGPSGDAPPKPGAASSDRFDAAVAAGRLDEAEREARAIVERVLDMPGSQANDNQAPFRAAVELLELRPRLRAADPAAVKSYFAGVIPGGDPSMFPSPLREADEVRRLARADAEAMAGRTPGHPRIASLRFVALQEAMRRDIPDGWLHEIQRKMTPDAWARLERRHGDWLAAYPAHPLADLVRMSKVRLAYLKGDDEAVWRGLLEVYPRHRPRALAEMRNVVLKVQDAEAGILRKSRYDVEGFPDLRQVRTVDPVLLTAFVGIAPVRPELWAEFWALSEANLPRGWAVNLQERLLLEAVRSTDSGEPLAAAFPAAPRNPTTLWGKLRLVALVQAGRLDQATAQAATLKAEPDIAPALARLHLLKGEWAEALAVPGLDAASRAYLIRTVAPDAALVKVAGGADPGLRREARLALAVRAAAAGDWTRGADLLKDVDAGRAARWREAARLVADGSPAGRLAFARFLVANAGRLFYPTDSAWGRSIRWRVVWANPELAKRKADASDGSDPDDGSNRRLPWTREEEQEAQRRYLTAGREAFVAVQAYAAWLEAAGPRHRQARAVLKEADRAFNSLATWDTDRLNDVWVSYYGQTDAAQTIRRVGKEIRAR